MQRCYALFILIRLVKLAAIEQLLYGANLAQPRQLHDILLDRKTWSLVRHAFQFMFARRQPVGFRLSGGRHLGGPLERVVRPRQAILERD